jgi:hypothetical protein
MRKKEIKTENRKQKTEKRKKKYIMDALIH